jgi:Holliday junction resolvase RusA-like endonuclease
MNNKLKIPIKPLTVNKVWQGRRFKTPLYKQYEKDCAWFVKGRKIKGEVEIHYRFYLKYYATTDVDNLIKPIQDIIVKAGLIEDDRKIKLIIAEKFKAKEDRMEIIITKYI